MGQMEEMVTMIHLDDERLMLTHYCMVHNHDLIGSFRNPTTNLTICSWVKSGNSFISGRPGSRVSPHTAWNAVSGALQCSPAS